MNKNIDQEYITTMARNIYNMCNNIDRICCVIDNISASLDNLRENLVYHIQDIQSMASQITKETTGKVAWQDQE